MATESTDVATEQHEPAAIESTVSGIRKMLLVGGLFAGVGYVLVVGALVLEFTQFHPLIESFAQTYPDTSLAGGGPERTAAASSQLASIHQFPSTLLWMKLGGIAHVLVGIFIALAAIIRALSVMPDRLSHELRRDRD